MKTIFTVMLKDLRLEGRSRDVLSSTLFFSALVMLILGFALGKESKVLVLAGPGILWTAIAFSSVLASGRAWASEAESEALEGLLLYPVPLERIYLGKTLANFILMLALSLIASPIAWVMYNFFPTSSGILGFLCYLLTLFLGVLGFSIVSTFYAALTSSLRAKEALLPILMFPVLVPVVLGAVNATSILATGGNISEALTWVALLFGFDLMYVIASSLLFPFIVEN